MFITVIDQHDNVHNLDAGASDAPTLMELIADAGIAIRAECGGGCVCATCHVYIDNAGTGQLPEPGEDEENALDLAYGVQANSRLACQIPMTDALAGIEVTVAPDWP